MINAKGQTDLSVSRLCNEWVSKIAENIIKITVHNELKRLFLVSQ